ncbi:MAG: hypothetical protein ABR589_04140 [Chthoniobacterales bacterium]
MRNSEQSQDVHFSNAQLIAGLQHTLEKNSARILSAAKNRWERQFAGRDPSDACVTVRISSRGSLGGISPRQIACQ